MGLLKNPSLSTLFTSHTPKHKMALQFVKIQPFIKKQINALKNKNILSKKNPPMVKS